MTPDTEDRLAGEGLRVESDPFSEVPARPWILLEMPPRDVRLKRTHWAIGQKGGRGVGLIFGDDQMTAKLVLAAVNAYDPDREQRVRELVAAARSTADWLIEQSRYKNAGHAAGQMNALERALAPFAEGK